MTTTIDTYVFDAYGTLFDVHSAIAKHARRIGPHATEISELWRARQVEYSWTYSLMGISADFWCLTERALDYAMARHEVHDAALKQDLMQSYLELEAYPEVHETLQVLKSHGRAVAVLSNGTRDMVEQALQNAGLAALVDQVISVDEARVFKPHPSVYQLATTRLNAPAQRISFQSCNPWDAAGAANFGFRAVWINRRGWPAEYPIPGLRLTVESLRGLAEI